jgi:hypothetical protein
MRIARALIVLAAALASTPAPGDEAALLAAAAKEFELIAAAHAALRAYDLRIDIAYANGGVPLPLQARVACDARLHCLRVFLNAITLDTPTLSLIVDTNGHTIALTAHDPDSSAPAGIDAPALFAAWSRNGGTLTGGELTPDGRRWLFRSSKPAVPAAQMYVDSTTHLLRRLVYEIAGADRARSEVDIHYTWGDAAQLDPAEFEVNRFIEEEGASVAPARDYAGYRIIRADHR